MQNTQAVCPKLFGGRSRDLAVEGVAWGVSSIKMVVKTTGVGEEELSSMWREERIPNQRQTKRLYTTEKFLGITKRIGTLRLKSELTD